MKFVFFGTPDVAEYTLEKLKEAGYIPELIVTAPDRPQGRKMILTPPPVKVWAEKNGVPFIQPEAKPSIKEIRNALRSSSQADTNGEQSSTDFVDLFIVVAYGKILSKEVLNAPRLGSINIHYSLLPLHRGASPVEASILAGDAETGVTIQQMEYKMDAGPVLATKTTAIGADETAPELRSRLQDLGAELLVDTLPQILAGEVRSKPQDESLATYCTKISKKDGEIDPSGDPVENYNKYRAYKNWPRTFFFDENGKRVIITEAELVDDKFVIKRIIPEGGKERDY